MLQHPLQLRIDNDGQLEISVGGKILASGKWAIANAEGDYKTEPAVGANLGPPVSKIVNAGQPGIIEQTYKGAFAAHTFVIDGDDLLITTVIQNTGTAPVPVSRVCGLTIHFARDATGYMTSLHFSYTQQQGIDIMHPSGALIVAGAAHARDDDFGVGIHTPSHLDRQKLIQAVWAKAYTIPKECAVQADFNDPIGVGEAKTFKLNFHFATADQWAKTPGAQYWQSLLPSYKRDFQKVFGPLPYVPDDRPLAQFAAVDSSWVRPDNPYGFNNSLAHRFDKASGVNAFLDMVVPGLKRSNGLGVIFWALAGWNQRGCMYRPDFDVFPPEVAANLSALVAGFKREGLRVGLASRPNGFAERETWTADQVTALSADSPNQMDVLWKRFSNMIALGFDMFYMDSFPLNYNDHRILKFLRKKAGPNILFFTEEGSDISTAYAGRYLEWHKDKQISWTTEELLEINRWLMPGASYACLRRVEDLTFDQMGAMKLTPLLPDFYYNNITPDGAPVQLFRMTSKYMNGKNWK